MNSYILQQAFNIVNKTKHKHPYRVCDKKLHYSFIFRGRSLLSWGWNSPIDLNVMSSDKRPSAIHAEQDALNRLYDYKGALSVLNIRVSNSGKLGMSKPCQQCSKLLARNNIHKIWYTNAEGEVVKL